MTGGLRYATRDPPQQRRGRSSDKGLSGHFEEITQDPVAPSGSEGGTTRRPDTVTYRRAELYEQVWKEPVRTVAQACGISDVWLPKICRKLFVPRPPRGYWIRKRSGWPDKPLSLTPLLDGKPVEITVPRRRQQVFLSRLLRPEAGAGPSGRVALKWRS